MNDQHLDSVFRNYIDKFDLMNDPRHNETYKWEAIQNFQKNWNIDADDFMAMFRKAIASGESLINTKVVQPTSGMIELARHDPEIVRRLFQDLFQTDGGDLKQRQARIEAFVTASNALLERHAPGKWKLAQDTRTAIAYLSLRDPDENYIYRATPARIFGRCVDFGHEIGSGSGFKLSQYYRLCDWVVDAIKASPELQQAHQRRLCERTYADGQFHVLAYDIIYCAQAYNLYGDIEIRKPRRNAGSGTGASAPGASRRNRAKEELLARQLARQDRIHAIDAEIESVHSHLEALESMPLLGVMVEHRKYGQGKVISQEDDIITVRFDTGERKFALPCAFTDCFLTTPDPAVQQAVTAMTDILKDEKRLERKRQLIRCESI